MFLSGTYSKVLPQYKDQFGYMLNANRMIGGEKEAVKHTWALDNGVFSDKWQEGVWLRRLEKLAEFTPTCIGAVVPDVISDHEATLERWQQYAQTVKDLGYKAAFATQLGATVENIPWDEVDVLFIGDSEVNRRQYCFPLIDEAIRRGIHVHVGRINSVSAIERYWRADSVDGTNFKFNSHTSRQAQERLLWATRRCTARKHYQLELSYTQGWLEQPTP